MTTDFKLIKVASFFLLCLGLLSCSDEPLGLMIAKEESFTYEKHIEKPGLEVVVPASLASDLRATLNSKPTSGNKGLRTATDTRRYLKVGTIQFQVLEDSLRLNDEWGTRSWTFKGIQNELDNLVIK